MPNVIEPTQLAADMDAALSRMLGNVTIYCRVVKVFFNAWPEHKQLLEEAWQAGHRERCVSILHKLAGGAKSIAAIQLAGALSSLELQLANNACEFPDIHLLDEIDALAQATHDAINRQLDCNEENFTG